MRSPHHRTPHASTRGRVGPGLILAGALTLSTAAFFGYTLPKLLRKPDPAPPQTTQSTPQPTPSTQPPPSTAQAHPQPTNNPPTARPPLATIIPPVLRPATEATATVTELARALLDRPAADALSTLAPGSTASEDDLALLQQIFRDGGFQLDPGHLPRQVGDIDGRTRWEFPIVANQNGTPTASSQITIDLVKGDDGRWRIAAITVPDALKNHIAQLPSPSPDPHPGATVTARPPGPHTPATTAPLDLTDPGTSSPNTKTDPLALADAFVQALAAGDFATARALTDPAQISDEKLAALFIVTEDGNFTPRPHRPVVTVTYDEDSALLIVRLGTPETPGSPVATDALNTEFGLELNRTRDGKWQVAGVNFSQLIADTAASLDAGDIAYSPLIDDPSGGDSLALYFPFDDAGVHPRAARQLNVVAAVLIADPNKRVKIDGHADARGSDHYNDRLSRERAINVRAALLSLGVPNDQIVMRVYGEAKPAAPNTLPDGTDNPPGRARNRRTEIYLDF